MMNSLDEFSTYILRNIFLKICVENSIMFKFVSVDRQKNSKSPDQVGMHAYAFGSVFRCFFLQTLSFLVGLSVELYLGGSKT